MTKYHRKTGLESRHVYHVQVTEPWAEREAEFQLTVRKPPFTYWSIIDVQTADIRGQPVIEVLRYGKNLKSFRLAYIDIVNIEHVISVRT